MANIVFPTGATTGPYGDWPNDAPKYNVSSGRVPGDSNLTVARIFLSASSVTTNSLPPILSDFFSGKSGKAYVGFILNQVTETRSEKSEIIPLAGDGFASYFFGENPSIYTFDGYFLNSKYARWRDIFDLMYRHIFRGSKVAGHRKLVRIAYDDRIVSGVMLSVNQVLASNSEAYSQYQFQVLVYDNAILLDETAVTNTDHLKGETSVFITNQINLLPLEANKDYTRTASIVRPPNALKPKAGVKNVCEYLTDLPEASGRTNGEGGDVVRSANVVNAGCNINLERQNLLRQDADIENKRKKTTKQDELDTLARQRSTISGKLAKLSIQEDINRRAKANPPSGAVKSGAETKQ